MKTQKQETFGIFALKGGGNMITDSLSKADILTSQFKYVLTPHSGNQLPQLLRILNAPKLNLYIFLKMVFSCYYTRLMYQCQLDPTIKLHGRLLQCLAKENTPVVH